MMSDADETLDYYNRHCEEFVRRTVRAELSGIQEEFLSRVHPGGTVLDFGCGSGRDTKYFLERGFRVFAVDGSSEICRAAEKYTGIPVQELPFGEFREKNRYDGIWACASLVHLPKKTLPDMFLRLRDALRERGVLYASFKKGTFEGMRDGRYFTDLDEESLAGVLSSVKGLYVIRVWTTEDARKERDDLQWINVLLWKTS